MQAIKFFYIVIEISDVFLTHSCISFVINKLLN